MTMTMQTGTTHPRGGWRQEEIELLFQAVKDAAQEGRPLRNVFCDVGDRLSRKPNSIRNYYYARVREAPHLAPRQTPFHAFTQEELQTLLRDVLMGRGNGESVRACVTRLAGGDRAAMLRYQNKYRAILKKRPELLLRVAEELKAEGLPCPETVVKYRPYGQAPAPQAEGALQTLARHMDDPAVNGVVNALCQLLQPREPAPVPAERLAMEEGRPEEPDGNPLLTKWTEARREADRLRVEVDLLKMALEDAREGKESVFDLEPDGGY